MHLGEFVRKMHQKGQNRRLNTLEIRDFVNKTVMELSQQRFDELKEHLLGEYIKFSFIDDDSITKEIFCEKIADYFEKLKLKTNADLDSAISKYLFAWDDLVSRGLPEDDGARTKRYYKYACEIRGSRQLTLKQMTDYSRILMCIYMAIIRSENKVAENFNFSAECINLDKILVAMKAEENGGFLGFGKGAKFDLEELYCNDTAVFVITMIMSYHISEHMITEEE